MRYLKGVSFLRIFLIFLMGLSLTYSGWASSQGLAEQTLKGQVTGVAKTISTITVEHGGKKLNIKYDEKTVFQQIDPEKIRELQGQEVEVKYVEVDGKYIAKLIKLAIAELPPGVSEISTKELAEIIKKSPGNYVLIDSRPAGRYNSSFIPTAISIPVTEMESKGEQTLNFPKDKLLIFYCGGPTCKLSSKAAGLAVKWGFKNVKVYLSGEPGWKKAGNYTESTEDFITKENIVLIDLRDLKSISKTGFIPKAVNIPLKNLQKAENKFPSYKKANIVVYSDKKDDIAKAIKIIRDWGYTNVTAYSGGVKTWLAKGYEVKKGSIPTKINYVRTYKPFEVPVVDFEKALKDGTALIVDVRTPDEFNKGHFKGAINIPVDDMKQKASSLPKDKPIYVHCATGVRAEMGYLELKNLGFNNVRVLIASVECEGDKCSITE